MEDMTGELITVLPKDCFAGCSDDATTTSDDLQGALTGCR